MKKRIRILACVCLCGVLFFTWAVWKGGNMRKRYPNPQIQTYRLGETLLYKGCEITFSDWQWGDGSLISEKLPEYRLSGTQSGQADARVGLITLCVRREEEGAGALDLADVSFSSGAWGNQFDLELFYLLNPDLKTMTPDPESGEEQRVILPLTLHKSQFTEKEWETIDSRRFYINIRYYPQHDRFACPAE